MNNSQLYCIKSEWYSWIPTNLGRLSFTYIGEVSFAGHECSVDTVTENEKYIIVSKTNLSDLNFINNIIQGIEEIADTALVHIKKESDAFNGKVSLNYNKYVRIDSNFSVEFSGKTKIFDVNVFYDSKRVNSVQESDTLNQTIVNAIYTILKKVIHGDNHHRQKVDTLIGVYQDSFDPVKIIDTFAVNIKSRERAVKDSTQSSCYYTQQKLISSIEVEGFLSYIETFKDLFCTEEHQSKCAEKIKFIKNVAQSLKASTEKIKFDLDLKQKTLTLLMTFAAFIVSVNIFHNGFYGSISCNSVQSAINYLVWSFYIIFLFYFVGVKFVCVSRLVSYFEVIWEYLRYKALYDRYWMLKIVVFSLVFISAILSFLISNILLRYILTKLMY